MRQRFIKPLVRLALAVLAISPISSVMADEVRLAYPAGHMVSTKIVIVPAGGRAPLHRHPSVESVYLAAGGGIVQVGDALREVKAGEMLLIPAGTPHGFSSGKQEARIVSTSVLKSGEPETELLEVP